MRQAGIGERGLLREARPRVRTQLPHTTTEYLLNIGSRGRALARLTAQLAVVVALLALAVLNVYTRATFSEPEDGVLWATTPEGVVAQEIAPDSPGARAGIRAGDILAEIDRTPVDTEADVVARLHRSANGDTLTYTLIRTK